MTGNINVEYFMRRGICPICKCTDKDLACHKEDFPEWMTTNAVKCKACYSYFSYNKETKKYCMLRKENTPKFGLFGVIDGKIYFLLKSKRKNYKLIRRIKQTVSFDDIFWAEYKFNKNKLYMRFSGNSFRETKGLDKLIKNGEVELEFWMNSLYVNIIEFYLKKKSNIRSLFSITKEELYKSNIEKYIKDMNCLISALNGYHGYIGRVKEYLRGKHNERIYM